MHEERRADAELLGCSLNAKQQAVDHKQICSVLGQSLHQVVEMVVVGEDLAEQDRETLLSPSGLKVNSTSSSERIEGEAAVFELFSLNCVTQKANIVAARLEFLPDTDRRWLVAGTVPGGEGEACCQA